MGPGSAEQRAGRCSASPGERCTASGTRDAPIARYSGIGVPTGMATNPNIAPILFDRALLRARQSRALRLGPATFLLDRVAEEFEERLHAVLRDFSDVAEIWTPGELLRKPSRDRFKSVVQIHPDQSGQEILSLQPE